MANKNRFQPTQKITDQEVELFRIQNRTKKFISFLKYSSIVGVAYCLYLCVDSLAGKTTFANFVVNILGNVTVNQWFAYIIGAGGTGYGVIQRRLRRKNIKRLTERNIKLESQINRKRRSSQLTNIGTTPN